MVWPKRHVEQISQLTDFEARDIANLLHQATAAVIGALEPQAFHTFCSAGLLVGQSEAHMHFQIQPRYLGRDYSFKSARDLPTVKLSDRRLVAAKLMKYTSGPGQGIGSGSLVFGDSKDLLEAIPPSELNRLVITDDSRFLSICHPDSRGAESILIVSKSQARTFVELDGSDRERLLILIRDLARAAEELFDLDGLSVWWESGFDAGQCGEQLAVEIVPRFHEVKYVYRNRADLLRADIDKLARVAEKYRGKVGLKTRGDAGCEISPEC